MRCLILTAIKPASVAEKVVIKIGINTSLGLAALNCALYMITVMGIKVRPAAFKTRNIICALLAVSLLGFSSCNSFIAFKPIGVAASPKPNIFADKFNIILPVAGCPLGTSGNNLLKKGSIQLATF